jgi:hypothetical protein
MLALFLFRTRALKGQLGEMFILSFHPIHRFDLKKPKKKNKLRSTMFDHLIAFGEFAESIFTPLDDFSSMLSTKFDSRLVP